MKLIAFDMSSFIWRSLLGGKDGENGRRVMHEDKEVWVNSATYGYGKAVDAMIEVMSVYHVTPMNCILVFEGVGSKSRRLLIDNNYKAERSTRPPESYLEFEKVKVELAQVWKDLGACTVVQPYAEGDDTLAWLAENTEEDLVVATFDGDLTTVNGRNKYGAEIESWIGGLRGVNKYGDFPHHLVPAYKALVGDGNEYKGCKGFGPGAFKDFVAAYGLDGLQEFYDLCLAGSLDPLHVMDDKLTKLIVASEESVLRSFQLALLRPEWVDTMEWPVEIERGLCKPISEFKWQDPRFNAWYAKIWLVTSKEFANATAYALSKLPSSPFVALDIETSTPEESDLWLERQGNPDGVDVFGSELTGLGLTFGDNCQFTMYFSVDHADTANITSEQLADFVDTIKCPIVIQNVSFELTALKQGWGERWKDNGNRGYLRNVRDTALEASYVDENSKRGLKERSMSVLKYVQETYDHVTQITAEPSALPKGGRLIGRTDACEAVDSLTGAFSQRPATETRRYKMRELTAEHVLNYGADDPRCTAALHNHYKLVMQLEHTYNVYKEVELGAAYLHAESFLSGVPMSIETMNTLAAIDDETYAEAWAVLRKYLISKGWEGTIPPVYTMDITPAQIKQAYTIVHEAPLTTAIRTVSKIITFIREVEDEAVFAGMLERCISGPEGAAEFTKWVQGHYKCEPMFNDGSTAQMQNLLYTTMGLPIRLRNKPTVAMKAKGIFDGTPKTDALAINYAMLECEPEQKEVLEALKLMAMVGTRRSLYYDKYPLFVHWKDGKIHSSHNQSSTNTRRASESGVNKQQMPKNVKIEGQPARFREVITPHKPGAVVVSMDFKGQELVRIADYSRDKNMLACYIGDNKKDMHSLTAVGILQRQDPMLWSYEVFEEARHDPENSLHKIAKKTRPLGKAVNFSTEFGAMAPKLALMLMVTVEEAQIYIDVKENTFPEVRVWKNSVIAEAKEKGYVTTQMGARRHLRNLLLSSDRWEASKAERQSVNFKIQSSSAEQTKLAEGRMWEQGLFTRFDAAYYGPIHDECVASVMIEDLPDFLPLMHDCMVAKYADSLIPAESSISFGPSFGVQIEIGEQPRLEAILEGLAELDRIMAKSKETV